MWCQREREKENFSKSGKMEKKKEAVYYINDQNNDVIY